MSAPCAATARRPYLSAMISYTAYRLIHLVGILLLFVALGGLSYAAGKSSSDGAPGSRGLVMALHGTGLLVILVGGFGLLARIGVEHGIGFPGWVWGKLAIWLLLGAAVMIPKRKPEWAGALFLVLPVLGGIASWLALYKPF